MRLPRSKAGCDRRVGRGAGVQVGGWRTTAWSYGKAVDARPKRVANTTITATCETVSSLLAIAKTDPIGTVRNIADSAASAAPPLQSLWPQPSVRIVQVEQQFPVIAVFRSVDILGDRESLTESRARACRSHRDSPGRRGCPSSCTSLSGLARPRRRCNDRPASPK